MASRRTAVVTVDEVTRSHYKVLSVYFIDSKTRVTDFHKYNPEIKTGIEVFEYVEKLAKNNGYILERNTDFGDNVPRILLQDIKNPGFFSIPYSL